MASACQPWPLDALGCCSGSVITTLVMASVLSCRQTLCLPGRRLAVQAGEGSRNIWPGLHRAVTRVLGGASCLSAPTDASEEVLG